MAPLNLVGKSYLITGSTDGIGLHTAKRLAKAGATVFVHGRNQQKADQAADSVKQASGSADVHALSADLASLDGVRQLADDVRHRCNDGINVLINNAGVFADSEQKTADGFELTWGVNVAAPFLLTSLLLDRVKERIVNVSSISAGSRIDFGNLNAEKGFSSHATYSLSKLAMQMFNTELAQRLPGPRPTANCLDPGTVNTKMLVAGWGSCGISIKDANDEFFLATDPSVANVTGKFFVSSRQRSLNQPAQDAEQRRRLWDVLVEQTGAEWAFE